MPIVIAALSARQLAHSRTDWLAIETEPTCSSSDCRAMDRTKKDDVASVAEHRARRSPALWHRRGLSRSPGPAAPRVRLRTVRALAGDRIGDPTRLPNRAGLQSARSDVEAMPRATENLCEA
jgi:hypothetical protein